MDKLDNQALQTAFANLSTPLIADALVRLDIAPRSAPAGIKPIMPGLKLAGWVQPAKHYGSVDVFFEAMTLAEEGSILVIDNQYRLDEACIGDLTALEARAFGIAAMVVWGCHRDTQELIDMAFPVFSYGSFSYGPLRVDDQEPDALTTARFGEFEVSAADVVFADDDGVLFAPGQHIQDILTTAHEIGETERNQAVAIAQGETMHQRLQFDAYLEKRAADPGYTFRQHLRVVGGAIEE